MTEQFSRIKAALILDSPDHRNVHPAYLAGNAAVALCMPMVQEVESAFLVGPRDERFYGNYTEDGAAYWHSAFHHVGLEIAGFVNNRTRDEDILHGTYGREPVARRFSVVLNDTNSSSQRDSSLVRIASVSYNVGGIAVEATASLHEHRGVLPIQLGMFATNVGPAPMAVTYHGAVDLDGGLPLELRSDAERFRAPAALRGD